MTKLYDYQKEGIRSLERNAGVSLLADDPGLGKSVQVLSWVKDYMDPGVFLVVCPANVKWHWEAEALRHVSIPTIVLEGKKPRKAPIGIPTKGRLMVVINYDILPYWVEFIQSLKPKLIVLDEAHLLGNRATRRRKAAKAVIKGVEHRIAVTGTPYSKDVAELWSVLNLIWPKQYPDFWTFAQKYIPMIRKPWGWEFKGGKNLDKLNQELVQNGMIRRLKKDVLTQLPPKTRIVTPIDLKDMREYDAAKKDFIAWLKRTKPAKISGAELAAGLQKMGYLKRLSGTLKLPSIYEWIDNFALGKEKKLIVFGIHKAVLKPLYERYKTQAVLVDGSVVQKARQDAFDRFTHDSRVRFFFGQIRAAGAGWPGQVASTVLKVEMDWVPGVHLQAEDRPHRIGQTKPVFVHYLVGRGTVEEDLCKRLDSRQSNFSKVFDADDPNQEMGLYRKLLLGG
jgi:SWI/SNF-related matrix-associated actin-dependent regulator 1 of chromatin subfamily A